MNKDHVVISSKGVDRLRAGHLWIYRSDVLDSEASPGAIVTVSDRKGQFQGKAFFSDRSQITLRFLSREDVAINPGFFEKRVLQAFELRQRVVKNSQVYRLLHAEADGLPSIIVDRYGDYLCIQTLTQGSEAIKSIITELLVNLFHPKGIIERNDSKARELEGLEKTNSILYGEVPREILSSENGLSFLYVLTGGQKTGAFLDQRENRARAQELAFGRALDCFCYEGGFAIQIAGSCEEVEALDISENAIRNARANAELNKATNIHFEAENVFDRLRLLDNLKLRYDTIILDPPAFAKNRRHLEAAIRGYKEINLRALRLLNPSGILITSTCSQLINENLFLNILAEAATDARKGVQIIEKRTQAKDHPILLTMPETYYLKCIVARIIS
jgi:23S rRNA (cytosine1962-C5)-methyltransferase